MSTITKLGVIEHGEAAIRILNSVRGLVHAGGEPVATVLVHDGRIDRPWFAREADEVIGVPALGSPGTAAGDPDDPGVSDVFDTVVGELQRAGIDGAWVGDIDGRDQLLAACERASIVTVGPGRDAVERMRSSAPAPPPGHDHGAVPCRRVEVDVLADDHGTVWGLGCRDVSIGVDGRMVLAESPCPGMSAQVADQLRDDAIDLVRRTGYRGAGLVTYHHDGTTFHMEGVDPIAAPVHATVEERTGTSIIAHRVRIASGERLPTREPDGGGVAVEAHLLADLDDAPDGRAEVALLAFPSGTGVRIDANRRPGDVVDRDDPLLAIVTAWGPERATALHRLHRALARTSVVLGAGSTNRSLLLAIAGHRDIAEGAVDDGWLERHRRELLDSPADPVALVAAAVEAYEVDRELAQAAFFNAAERGRPEPPADVGGRIQLTYRGTSYALAVDRTGPDSYSIQHGDAEAELTLERLDTYERRVSCGGRNHRVVVAPTASGWRIEVDGIAHHVDRDDGSVVRAGWPALVVAVTVAPGQEVSAGQPIAVLESMKMETTVTAPFDGEVTSVEVAGNSQVERGAPLLRIRPHRVARDVGAAAAVDLRPYRRSIDPTRKACLRVYEPLGNYLLGYDLSPEALHRLVVSQRRLAEIAEVDDLDLLGCEDGLLDIYADLCALYRPRTELDVADEQALDLGAPEGTQEYLAAFVQWLDADHAGLSEGYRARLLRALGRYGVRSLEHTPELESALTWLFRSIGRLDELGDVVTAILRRRLDNHQALAPVIDVEAGALLDRLATATLGHRQTIADLARDVRFHYFDAPAMEAATESVLTEMSAHFDALAADPDGPDRSERVARLIWCPHPLRSEMLHQWQLGASEGDEAPGPTRQYLAAEIHLRRFYRIRDLGEVVYREAGGFRFAAADYDHDGQPVHVVVAFLPLARLADFVRALHEHVASQPAERRLVVDVVAWRDTANPAIDVTARELCAAVDGLDLGRPVRRLAVTITSSEGAVEEHLRTQGVTLRQADDGTWSEDEVLRNLHPMLAERLEMWRLAEFTLERRPSPEDVYLFLGVARENPNDRRLFALAEIRELTAVDDPVTGETHYPRLERTGLLALAAMRTELARFSARERPLANRLVLDITAPWTIDARQVRQLSDRFAGLARRAGLEKLVLKIRIPDESAPGGLRPSVLHFEGVGQTVLVREDSAGDEPVQPLGSYRQKVLTAARFGVPYPYEIARLLTRRGARDGRPADSFVELDLAPGVEPVPGHIDELVDRLEPVDRPPGNNTANIVVGLITHHTDTVPEGIQRVALLSDPTRGLGNLAEPECRRVNAALAYALEHRIPVEWFAVSSGALIAMDSGTENMDWIALTLRRLIEFTQAGGEVNIIVTGINVGGQPYWNAEATMLMHTRGILIMSPNSTMVLTGKQALDFSGAVSAEDNHGIGGYERVMGPNGQAQYFASSFDDACEILRQHYELTYVVPGERFPRRQATSDPTDRDVRPSPHTELAESPFTTVGDVFSPELNPERKQPFDMRSVMRAVADADCLPLERWRDLRDGETSIVWDTTIGGIPVCLLGLESHTVARRGFVPADGPPSWTSGTLFPHSSRKTARAINAASGNRPLVVLANLSGFDGSPESMRRRQLEYGAEIGRSITNFDGPIVFVVVSRYHGGAFVVFSKALNAAMEIAAVEGSFASVIGGAPAAATVFAREVKQRTQRDDRVQAAAEAAAAASGPDAAVRRAELARVTAEVRSQKLGEVAHEFDGVHTIERARKVGSVDRIIPAEGLRPYVIDALERGMARFGPTDG